jgi:hypothetical protein
MKTIEDAALNVMAFVKSHTYPKEGSPEFFVLIDLLDQLETAIVAKYPNFVKNLRK